MTLRTETIEIPADHPLHELDVSAILEDAAIALVGRRLRGRLPTHCPTCDTPLAIFLAVDLETVRQWMRAPTKRPEADGSYAVATCSTHGDVAKVLGEIARR